MQRYAFRMQLKPGMADAYRRRHDEIWPELVQLLRDAGVSDYTIHHDPESDALFAIMWRRDAHEMADLPSNPLMRRWWAHMADLMETHPDNEPVAVPLDPMFQLP